MSLSFLPAAQPQSVGIIAGTIATGVLAVIICLLLVVVVFFYWKNRNKYEEDEIPNEIRLVYRFVFEKSRHIVKLKGSHRVRPL